MPKGIIQNEYDNQQLPITSKSQLGWEEGLGLGKVWVRVKWQLPYNKGFPCKCITEIKHAQAGAKL